MTRRHKDATAAAEPEPEAQAAPGPYPTEPEQAPEATAPEPAAPAPAVVMVDMLENYRDDADPVLRILCMISDELRWANAATYYGLKFGGNVEYSRKTILEKLGVPPHLAGAKP